MKLSDELGQMLVKNKASSLDVEVIYRRVKTTRHDSRVRITLEEMEQRGDVVSRQFPSFGYRLTEQGKKKYQKEVKH